MAARAAAVVTAALLLLLLLRRLKSAGEPLDGHTCPGTRDRRLIAYSRVKTI